ncbi:hypothetical protein scyTo_0021356 [Scyliorhinus torazame]|uniref:Uncharacterized protein n=1 Tax=Scyliorhinus torazame TaxID=75743 RepID=A0A401Q795_SCYTO|nr:hypothetical protein [Scyliorhinus torazame]
MPGDRTRSQRKGTSLQKVNKVLVKGVKQLFANQRESVTESNGIHSTGAGLGIRRKSSLLRSYMLASDDEMSLVVPDSQRPSISDTNPLSRHVFSKPQSERRWYRDPKRAGLLPTHIRPHFIPKGSRKSPEVSKKLLTNMALESRAGLVTTLPGQAGTNLRPEERSWTGLHDLQTFRPLEFVSHVGAKAVLTPPLELGSETSNVDFLEIETDADEVKSKRKMRMEYSRLFTISSTFSRMRGLKKVKVSMVW